MTATVIVQELDGTENSYQISKRDNEPNFVDALGRFIHEKHLEGISKHEVWNAAKKEIKLIKITKPSHSEGTCF